MILQTAAKPGAAYDLLYPIPPPAIELYFVLNGKLSYRQEEKEELYLSAGQYNIFFYPNRSWSDSCRNNTDIFIIPLTFSCLQDWTLAFPTLLPFLDKITRNIACRFSEIPGIADPEMITLIGNIRECLYTGDLKDTYLELQLSSLLTLALAGTSRPATKTRKGILLKPEDIEKIQATREYLLRNMDHPPTLIELARKMGINDYKLKKGFRQLYGTTLFDDFLHARMKKARQLLVGTRQSIVAIADTIGYKNVSSFSVAFKRYFGYTPGHLRKIN